MLNNLYQQTQMGTVFGINMVALLDGRPRCMNLKELLEAFIDHRREVVTRRTVFELRKARERAHILEGQAVALANIDEIIDLIKSSPTPAEAKDTDVGAGMACPAWCRNCWNGSKKPRAPARRIWRRIYGLGAEGYRLSPVQAQAILDLRLHRLTGLEQDKIIDEYKVLLGQIDELLRILADDKRLMEVITRRIGGCARPVRRQAAHARSCKIAWICPQEDLITEEDMVVTVSHEGYVKSQPLGDYRSQRRGGRGKQAAATKEEDYIEKLIVANTHDTILCFSSVGKVYWLKVYELPVASRTARGKPFVNMLPLVEGERINAILPVREFDEDHFIFMATASATVKKVPLTEFERQRTDGKIAIDLREDDHLVNVAITNGEQDVLLFSSDGKVVCFKETDVRADGPHRRRCARHAPAGRPKSHCVDYRQRRHGAEHHRKWLWQAHQAGRIPPPQSRRPRRDQPSRPPPATARWSARRWSKITMKSC